MIPAFYRLSGNRRRIPVAAYVALAPAIVVVVLGYVTTMLWNVEISFTGSNLLPVNVFVGTKQYERLFTTARWLISLENMLIFGVLFIAFCLVFGFLLAVALDQKIRFENAFRTIFLYPFSMSFIVTGLVWQWIMNPTLGLQHSVQSWGWTTFRFDWIVQNDFAIYAVVVAGVWQSTGLATVILLAGIRGVDPELWKAARVDGLPAWRIYWSVVIPELRPMAITAIVLLIIAAVRVYDLVLALTGGGPGISSEVPAKFIMDYLFGRGNIALATAGSTVMLVIVLAVLAPWIYYEYFSRKSAERGAR
jgi:glucose/mannose transport system permease protein